MLSFYLIWSLSYFLLLWWMSSYWKEEAVILSNPEYYPTLTLLIPLRNEQENIPLLISQIKQIAYPDFQVILIDDHSEDQTLDLLKTLNDASPKIHIVKNNGVGKKAAIETGIKNAKNELILCTDADCTWGSNWLSRMVKPFQNPKIQLVAGPVISRTKQGLLESFQQLEWISILMVSNFAIKKSNPIMCSAANLCYRKSAFEKVNGYAGNEHFASGDDEFLLKKVNASFGSEAITYMNEKESLILTEPENKWENLFSQRVRWAGKWKAHGSFKHAAIALIPVLVQIIWISTVSLFILGTAGFFVFLVCWVAKILSEGRSFGRILRSLGYPLPKRMLLMTSFFHPVYVLWVSFGTLKGNFVWKGRVNGRSL